MFFFKFGAALHYTLLSPLGEHIFPIWIVGLLIGGATLIQVIFDVPAGFLLDRYGYVRLLKVGTIAFALASAAFFFGLHQWNFILSIFFAMLGWMFFGPGVDAYVLSKAKKEFAGKFIATKEIFDSAGVVVGMLILAILLDLHVPIIAAVLLFLFLIAFFALRRAPKDTHSVHEEQKIPHQKFHIRRHYLHHVISAFKKLNLVSTLLVLSGLSSATFYGIIWFVVPILIAHTLQNQTLSIGLMIFDFSVLVVGFLIGHLTDTWNKQWLIFIGLLLFAVMAFLVGFHFGVLFIILGFLATTGDEMAGISLWAWLDHLDKDHAEDGLITGVISLAQDVGWTIGPIIAGFLYIFWGPSWTIAAGAAFIFVTWIISLFMMGFMPKVHLYTPWKLLRFSTPRFKRHKR